MFRIHFLHILLLSGLAAQAQTPCETPAKIPFAYGEYIEFELNYNWGLLWIQAGGATFEVLEPDQNDSLHFHFKAEGKSKPSWDWFYKVHSIYESYTDSTLTPTKSSRKGQEGSRFYDDHFYVKEDSILFISKNRNKEILLNKKLPKTDCSLDVTTAVYYCRAIDFSAFEPGDRIDLPMYIDGAAEDTYIRYEGKEIWTDPKTKEKIECFVIHPYLVEGSVFKSGENMTIYVRNDEHRVPVYIETKLVVGKAKIFLTRHEP